MKQEFKDWFIEHTKRYDEHRLSDEVASRGLGSYNLEFQSFWKEEKNRKYTFYNIAMEDVPFYKELNTYINSLHSFTNTFFKWYHVHIWGEGDYFKQHTDNHVGRVWSYVCELKSSECNTSLLVDGKEVKEAIFDTKTVHEVPPIKKGTRISLTVFGLSKEAYPDE